MSSVTTKLALLKADPTDLVDVSGDLSTNFQKIDDDVLPVGALTMWPVAAAPAHWLLCDGAAVSRATYATLFALIGVIYGAGDGVTTFNLPNLKGKAPVGVDAGQAEFTPIAHAGGEKTHLLIAGEIPNHLHHGAFSNGSGSGTPAVVDSISSGANSGRYAADFPDTSGGGGGAHNNLPPYIAINFIIKALYQ